ncbi:MAG: ABC transporter permease [bacterium]
MSIQTADTNAAHPTSVCSRTGTDRLFWLCLWIIAGTYILLIMAMILADASFTSPWHLWQALDSPYIRYSIWLSLISCTATMILSVWVSVPIGYLLSRYDFRGKNLVDAVLDIPIVLPPLVIGLSLLILFQTVFGKFIENHIMRFTYEVSGVILAQFTVACAFAVRTMRATFESTDRRHEHVALTLGCSQSQAFWLVIIPEARRGILTAATLAWARAMGEFGPILIFAGATRLRTEVLPTTVFLELSVGNIEAAVAVSLIMVISAVLVLLVVRFFGLHQATEKMV